MLPGHRSKAATSEWQRLKLPDGRTPHMAQEQTRTRDREEDGEAGKGGSPPAERKARRKEGRRVATKARGVSRLVGSRWLATHLSTCLHGHLTFYCCLAVALNNELVTNITHFTQLSRDGLCTFHSTSPRCFPYPSLSSGWLAAANTRPQGSYVFKRYSVLERGKKCVLPLKSIHK